MIQKSRMLKTIIAMVITSMIMNSAFVSTVVAEDDSDPSGTESVVVADADVEQDETLKAEADANIQRSGVVVSMGDSFSAGEGIEPFYGTRASTGIAFEDWLAHRSQESWPGQLVVPGIGELRSSKYGNCDDPHWYFVAASGAVISNVTNDQQKSYILDNISDVHTDGKLPRQDWILTELNSKNIVPDYITMTLGGNDVDFVDVIVTAAMNDAYKDPAAIDNKMEAVRKKLKDHVAKELFQTYQYINDTSSIGDIKPCILVAGYPHLLNSNASKVDWNAVYLGGPIYQAGMSRFDYYEAEEINKNIDLFNAVIEAIVNKCREDDRINLNIHFVDVTEAFRGFEAYTKDAMLNGILLPSLISDLDIRTFNENGFNPSAYSMHPNKRGAKDGYAKCVQAKIDELEGYKVAESVELIPTPTPLPDQESSVASESEPSVDVSASTIAVGSEITMGEYRGEPITWVVMYSSAEKVLVISKDILEAKPYHDKVEEVTWETCSLRTWLNGEFYESSFSDEEKKRILQTTNRDDPPYGCPKGNDTEDYVFLISSGEIQSGSCMDANILRIAAPKDYLTSDDILTVKGGCYWWTRTLSSDTVGKTSEMCVYEVACHGDVVWCKDGITNPNVGVRPAMWLDSNSLEGLVTTNMVDQNSDSIKSGDMIAFGHYEQDNISDNGTEPIEWEVLDVQGDKVMVISKYALDHKLFNDERAEVSWETCTLRSWLNNDFMNIAFSSEEQELIYETNVVNGIDPEFGIDFGNDTVDKLYLLSWDECIRYYDGARDLDDASEGYYDAYLLSDGAKCRPTRYAIEQGVKVSTSFPTCYWWTRSGRAGTNGAMAITCIQSLDYAGFYVDEDDFGVRPVMWISMETARTAKIVDEDPQMVQDLDEKLLGKWVWERSTNYYYYYTFYDDNTVHCERVKDGELNKEEDFIVYSDGTHLWIIGEDKDPELAYYVVEGDTFTFGDTPVTTSKILTRVN